VVAAGIWGGVLVLMFRSARAQPCETPKILRVSVLQVSSFQPAGISLPIPDSSPVRHLR
jgi:hypothetical protein